MRFHREFWLVPALVTCAFHIAFACGEEKKGSIPAVGQALKDDRTVFVSVLMTNSGAVRDAVVLGGTATLSQAAIETVRQRRYTKKEIDNWGTSTPSALRHVMLAVTFPGKEGASPKIHPGSPSGVSACVSAGSLRVIVLPSSSPPSFLTSWPPVMPVLAQDSKELMRNPDYTH